MISQDEARTRVGRGAAHLDVVRPGWFNRIDVGTLTLHDPCGCIVGQLCRGMNYESGEDALAVFDESGVRFGFDLYRIEIPISETRQQSYAPLQDAWIEAIADRRLSTTVEVQTAIDAVGLSVVEPVAVHARI